HWLPIGFPRMEVLRALDLEHEARHGRDYRSVWWFGTLYTFTANQAKVVAVLWDAWRNRTPDVGEAYLLEELETNHKRLRDVFRERGPDGKKVVHPAWGTMIVSHRKGTHRLNLPLDCSENFLSA